MKTILIFLITILPGFLFAQQNPDDTPADRQIKGVVIAGFNLAQVDGDEVYGYNRLGANVGVGALLPLGKGFYFGIETLFNQKGAYKKRPPAGDSTGVPYYKLKLDYLDVPVMFFFEDRHIWTIGLGASWGRRVDIREVERGNVMNSDSCYSKNDWNALISLQLRVWRHLKVDLRYSYSMVKLRTREFTNQSGASWSRNQYHNIISVRLLYLLNEKYTPKPKTKKKKNITASIRPWNP